jgi:hypothetical protein
VGGKENMYSDAEGRSKYLKAIRPKIASLSGLNILELLFGGLFE